MPDGKMIFKMLPVHMFDAFDVCVQELDLLQAVEGFQRTVEPIDKPEHLRSTVSSKSLLVCGHFSGYLCGHRERSLTLNGVVAVVLYTALCEQPASPASFRNR